MWHQKLIRLTPHPRGYHLITDEVIHQVPELADIEIGLLHLFIQHTSASLTINENADPTVRGDMERHLNKLIPDNEPHYLHNYEGVDDMPAHIKSSVMGSDLMIPIRNGHLIMGTWQGIWLGEHRDHGGHRQLVATLQGQGFS
ncbi:secondary thiamine-phosphate synthase enzyme YjbQ [Sansalvadorimonas sp. 2012CJ34-2]|uniref:Secondary thiamine-phosphate synthase enzyme YjbQ n=1 Tax=Parendozoicomonas callyspongiae TaxID=2942213 RepID=A0ABT0PIR6_9GAMM|nr:secondary thiamine-phosphate synthase enzyme YjbQ [Sansalvadorimonas sp. 2012CJ34-2]MCL6271245.1 secondary thiamine-phosphate synthase enzyme YjbQ [Sansalvadorimonas sp. 2012CJ34-2]